MKADSSCISRWTKKIVSICKGTDRHALFENEAAVEKKAKECQRVLIMYKDNVYDVTSYLDKHPGGRQILEMANSKIVDKLFDKYHYPKGDAPKILSKYLIGRIDRTVKGVSDDDKICDSTSPSVESKEGS